MKIIYGMLGHEANTFSVEKGTFERFAPNGWAVGEEIYEKFKDSSDYPSGMIQAAEKHNVELLPTVALQNAAPLLTKECLDKVVGTLMNELEKYADVCDGVCLALHGAGVAEGVDDLEAYILTQVRQRIGETKPITVCLDLHGNISQEMVELSNGLFGIKEYPHIDAFQAGYLAMESLIGLIQNTLHLETAFAKTNMLIPCPVGVTTRMPMQFFKELVMDYAKEHHLYDATFFHGFPYANVPCCSASVVVVTDKNSDISAQEAAAELAEKIWDKRELLHILYPQPEDALNIAIGKRNGYHTGYVLINETSDNAGGGCPGDGTYLLRALLDKNIPRSIFGYIYDKDIALEAHRVGVGGEISGLLGGKTDHQHGEPLLIHGAKVLKLSDQEMVYKTPVIYGLPVYYGKAALLQIGNVHVIVTELMPEQTFDDCPFIQLDIHLEDNMYDIVCIKSTNHFRAFFEDKILDIVTTDPPGIQTANLSQLNFDRVKRPIWPLDI